MKTIQEMAREAGAEEVAADNGDYFEGCTAFSDKELEVFAELVRADERDRAMRENAYVLAERDRITQLLYKMHERAASQHNYYKHAAIELNRKASEGEKS